MNLYVTQSKTVELSDFNFHNWQTLNDAMRGITSAKLVFLQCFIISFKINLKGAQNALREHYFYNKYIFESN